MFNSQFWLQIVPVVVAVAVAAIVHAVAIAVAVAIIVAVADKLFWRSFTVTKLLLINTNR